MTYLPDVNVWLALATDRHVHHRAAQRWFDTLDIEAAHFCRITQMALLRLLTNPRIMAEDVLAPVAAWTVYDSILGDSRVSFSAEPVGIEERWRAAAQDRRIASGTWTDTYLMSFAHARGLRPVSFDRGFECVPGAVILRG